MGWGSGAVLMPLTAVPVLPPSFTADFLLPHSLMALVSMCGSGTAGFPSLVDVHGPAGSYSKSVMYLEPPERQGTGSTSWTSRPDWLDPQSLPNYVGS